MTAPVTIVIPTYGRERVLLETLEALLRLDPGADEILVVDQTPEHEPETEQALEGMARSGRVRRVRLPAPSITRAMNVGLRLAVGEIVLFLDDDIVPGGRLVAAHRAAQESGHPIVAGQVLQPGEEAGPWEGAGFRFSSDRRQQVAELMGGNFSVRRDVAMELGGFDENFVRAAYRFEAEFCERAMDAGHAILFDPAASVRHLRAARGGTRAYGEHLATLRPGHAVGAYYHLLRSRREPHRLRRILVRPLRAVRTRHHLARPWWIPGTLLAEVLGLLWACRLSLRGPRLIR